MTEGMKHLAFEPYVIRGKDGGDLVRFRWDPTPEMLRSLGQALESVGCSICECCWGLEFTEMCEECRREYR